MDLLPKDLPDTLIVFDGVCVLCEGFFQFTVGRDHEKRFRFATAQSETGQQLYRALGLSTDTFDTVLVYADGTLYTHAQAFGAVMGVLGGRYKLLVLFKYLPHWLTDWAYSLIARNRFRLFGRRDACLIPAPELQDRFLP